MSDFKVRRLYQLEESDEMFWDGLREVSERLGWEIGQTLKACIALGWEQLTLTLKLKDKEHVDDKTELE